MQKCKKCNEEKKLTEFYKNKSMKTGYNSCCRECAIEIAYQFNKRHSLGGTCNCGVKFTEHRRCLACTELKHKEQLIDDKFCDKICKKEGILKKYL